VPTAVRSLRPLRQLAIVPGEARARTAKARRRARQRQRGGRRSFSVRHRLRCKLLEHFHVCREVRNSVRDLRPDRLEFVGHALDRHCVRQRVIGFRQQPLAKKHADPARRGEESVAILLDRSESGEDSSASKWPTRPRKLAPMPRSMSMTGENVISPVTGRSNRVSRHPWSFAAGIQRDSLSLSSLDVKLVPAPQRWSRDQPAPATD